MKWEKCIVSALWFVLDSAQAQEPISPPADQTCQPFFDAKSIHFSHAITPPESIPLPLPDDAIVGQIRFRQFPIFNLDDPAENNLLFRGANRFHALSETETIEVQLLFKQGDHYDVKLLEESARVLRAKSYLYDAQVFPFRVCGNRVDIMVITRDVWTLTPGISFSRAGGVNNKQFLLRENNFLGWGKQVTLSRKETVDREGWRFSYKDPNLFGSRLKLSLRYNNNDDGMRQQAALSEPFYALNTPRAWKLVADKDDRVDTLYQRGEPVSKFRIEQHRNEVSGGWLAKQENNRIDRTLVGFSWYKESNSVSPGEIPPVNFPEDREINQVWLGRQMIEDEFITLKNFNQLYLTEDINLGQSWVATLGWADKDWNSDKDRAALSTTIRSVWQINQRQLLVYRFELSGYWLPEENKGEEVLLSNRFRYYQSSEDSTGLYLALDLDYVRNLPANQQLLLGGEENLRGYPLRYQDGDRRILLTMEKRYYFNKHWYRLFRTGLAIFADAGRAWFPNERNRGATGLLSNIGIGLRLASSRAEKNLTLHIDLAIPLKKEDDVDEVQFLVTGKKRF